MSNFIIVPDKVVDAMISDLRREHRKYKLKKICLCLFLIISIIMICGVVLFFIT